MPLKRKKSIKTEKDSWGTPQWLFDLLDREFHFNFDAAASYDNGKCNIISSDSLNIPWYKGLGMPSGGRVWLNPPYSAGNIDRFMQKAYEESQKGAVVVCLVPCATDTKWWHQYAMKAQEIRFIKGRVRFVGYDEEGKEIRQSPTFSSCVVIFDGRARAFFEGRGLKWNDEPPRVGPVIEQPKKGRTPA